MKNIAALNKVPPAEFFPLAATAVSLLRQAHLQRPLHGAINAATLCLSGGAPALADVPAGSQHLAYISPEQTGRTNRAVDYRSDYYSLGVVFYELLTGSRPFAAADAMELVHSHIAQRPKAPAELDPSIPRALSGIVQKLLAKNAEDRYQSLDGLLADLRRCEGAWSKEGGVPDFVLGQDDVSERLQVPQKLYGRAEEIKRLLNAFVRVANGRTEMLLVSGYSGVGKSSLVSEIQGAIVESHGIYLAGKFDQYKRDIPYATLAQAFRGLIRHILGSSEGEVHRWRGAILAVAGANGRLLTDLIPELEYVIGKQPPVAELAPGEAENRFLSVFRQFIGVFAKAAHPLVLFLDDLQWVDAGSMKLLEHVITHGEIRHLLLIGAYRDNEVEAADPMMLSLAAIRNSGGVVHDIFLGPLTLDDMAQLIAATLHCTPARAMPLVQLLHAKAAGNPFFTIQFLTALQEEGLLTFDRRSRTWHWDIEHIGSKSFSDNVVELMVVKLRRLPPATLAMIKHLACLGNSAHISILTMVANLPEQQTEALFNDALRAGLVLRLGESVKFAHDRIQEAAYSLIPQDARIAVHLQIGRLLLSRMAPEEVDDAVFDLVHQFNRGLDLITDPQERDSLCRLNSLAGKKARASVAYASARNYLAQAIALLPPESEAWGPRYETTFPLYLECAECEFVIGNFSVADDLLAFTLAHARSHQDHARVARVRIRMYYVQTRGNDCLDVALTALALFGVNFPEDAARLQEIVEQERARLAQRLQGRAIADLIDLPVATDPDARVIIGLLAEMLTAAYSTRPAIALPVLLKALDLSLTHGNIEESCAIYSNYGMTLAGLFGDISAGFEFSQMSLRLNERFNDTKLRGRLLFIHGYAFNATRESFAASIPILEHAFVVCREAGNIGFAGASADALVWMAWEAGKPLAEVIRIAEPYKEFTRRSNSFTANCVIEMLEQLMSELRGTPPPGSEADLVNAIVKARWNYTLGHYHIIKQVAHYTFGRHELALAAAEQAEAMPSSLRALASMVTHYFYHALTLAALWSAADPARRPEIAAMLKVQLGKLQRWAESCPANYQDRYALASAELARIEGRSLDAMRLYEEAIRCAQRSGLVHNAALAHELAAAFQRGCGLDTAADAHLRHARDHYLRWGASAKVAQLEQLHPQLAADASAASAPAGLQDGVHDFDLMAVMKASQAVSGEIVLGRLVESLVRTVVENAGAERGLLLLPADAGFHIAAEACAQGGRIAVFLRQEPVTPADLPLSIFHYVARTGERVLLDDAADANPYADDSYTRETRLKSVLCLPLTKQARLVGVLYLENRLTAGAFTPERIAVLELLASQAVISLENATLYSELQQENSERRRAEEALRQKTGELEAQAFFMNTVIENIPVAVFVKNARNDFRFTVWNKAAEQIFGMPKDYIIGKRAHDIWPGEQADTYLAGDRQVASQRVAVDVPEQVSNAADKRTLLLHTKKVPLINQHDAQIDYLLGISEDITERRQTEAQLQLAAMVYQHSSEAMMVNDADNNIIAINPAFTQLTGYAAHEVLGKNPRLLSSGRHDAAFHQAMWQTLNSSGQWRGEYWNRRKDGEVFAAASTINTIRNDNGAVHRYLSLFSDITQKKASEALIWQQANFDALTHLPNRSMFRDQLKQDIKKSNRRGLPLAILFIDLDRFKEVNDTLGHDKGDVLLIEAARRIRQRVRETDTVARLGGDEFTVILSELDNPGRVETIAQGIINSLTAPFQLGAEQAFISASIGITLYPNDATEIEDLLKHADQALYVAKDAGRNRFSYFTPSLQIAALARMRLTKDLRGALEEGQFKVFFQPVVHMASGQIHKAEALIRWQHPQRGLVSPAEFIPLAEASGLVLDIGEWVFQEAAYWVKRWRTESNVSFQVSVNQSPLEFQRPGDRYARWLAHLQELGLSGQAIALEITEGLLLDASPEVIDKLLKLRDAGIQVAIDDFGTGYSSLSYLRKFDIDYLKIDQSFTRNLAPGSNDMALSEAIIMMAHKLGLKVIAEGVETVEQRELLRAAGCDYYQGFLFGQPMQAEKFDAMLRAGRTGNSVPAHAGLAMPEKNIE